MVGIIEGFRWSIIGSSSLNTISILSSLFVSFALFLLIQISKALKIFFRHYLDVRFDIAIKAEGLSKKFNLQSINSESYTALRDIIARKIKHTLLWITLSL